MRVVFGGALLLGSTRRHTSRPSRFVDSSSFDRRHSSRVMSVVCRHADPCLRFSQFGQARICPPLAGLFSWHARCGVARRALRRSQEELQASGARIISISDFAMLWPVILFTRMHSCAVCFQIIAQSPLSMRSQSYVCRCNCPLLVEARVVRGARMETAFREHESTHY